MEKAHLNEGELPLCAYMQSSIDYPDWPGFFVLRKGEGNRDFIGKNRFCLGGIERCVLTA